MSLNRSRLNLWLGVGAFCVNILLLGLRAADGDLAAPYTDPIGLIRAQDECVHVHSTTRMLMDRDWLTPKVMGRPFLFKAPLLQWLTAISIDAWGPSVFAARLPAALAAALASAAIVAWLAKVRSVPVGVLTGAVLASDPIWDRMGRLCYTDILAGGSIAGVLAVVARDPQLMGKGTSLAVGSLIGLAFLAKSVVGLLPLLGCALFWIIGEQRGTRPRPMAIAIVLAVAVVMSAPWHIYQLLSHRDWFIADYIQVQLIGVGSAGSASSIFEHSPLFYLERLALLDSPLLLWVGIGCLGVWHKGKILDPSIRLTISFLVVIVSALCVFRAKNVPYLVLIIPVLCAWGGLLLPRSYSAIGIYCASGILLLRLFVHVPFVGRAPEAPPVSGAQALRMYSELGRGDRELIAVEADDELYGLVLGLPKIRYAIIDRDGWVRRFMPHYAGLGIVLSLDQYLDLPKYEPKFQSRLAQWDVATAEPIGAVVTLSDDSDIGRLVAARPNCDFYLPARIEELVRAGAKQRTVIRYSEDRIFVLSTTSAVGD